MQPLVLYKDTRKPIQTNNIFIMVHSVYTDNKTASLFSFEWKRQDVYAAIERPNFTIIVVTEPHSIYKQYICSGSI